MIPAPTYEWGNCKSLCMIFLCVNFHFDWIGGLFSWQRTFLPDYYSIFHADHCWTRYYGALGLLSTYPEQIKDALLWGLPHCQLGQRQMATWTIFQSDYVIKTCLNMTIQLLGMAGHQEWIPKCECVISPVFLSQVSRSLEHFAPLFLGILAPLAHSGTLCDELNRGRLKSQIPLTGWMLKCIPYNSCLVISRHSTFPYQVTF